MATCSGLQLEWKLPGPIWLINDVEVFHFHFEEAIEHFVILTILEIEDRTFSRIVQFVES